MAIIDARDPRAAVREGAAQLRSRWDVPLRACLIAGSGFADLGSLGTVADRCAMRDVPGLPRPSVTGHGGEVLLLESSTGHFLVFTGRVHAYEGHSPSACAAHVALARCMDVRSFILTNACGGLHPMLRVGDIVVVSDLVNWTSRAIAYRSAGQRSGAVIDARWSEEITRRCWSRGRGVRNGTYVQVTGPSYETRAEIRMLRRIGADVVGMSTAMEASWLARTDAHVAVISLVTNTLTDADRRLVSHDEVIEASHAARPAVLDVLTEAMASSPIFAP